MLKIYQYILNILLLFCILCLTVCAGYAALQAILTSKLWEIPIYIVLGIIIIFAVVFFDKLARKIIYKE